MHDYRASSVRYDAMPYRRVGHSGLLLPALSLGFWHNFGAQDCAASIRERVLTAFDLGITHFDLANDYGPPDFGAETSLGHLLAHELAAYRDELVVSSKAGWRAWPGPYGDFGSRKFLFASLDRSLRALQLDYVDIFYHHRPDPETSLEETVVALHDIVQSGRARYIGISAYSSAQTQAAAAIFAELRTPFIIHQPRLNLLDRSILADGLFATLDARGLGAAIFSPLAQGLLSNRYLEAIPADSRAVKDPSSLDPNEITPALRRRLLALNELASQRGQSLAQMAIAWILRFPTVATVLLGASSLKQLKHNLHSLAHLDFSSDELTRLDEFCLG
jgi:L-glyceraldehyde 3-phosphate reductase